MYVHTYIDDSEKYVRMNTHTYILYISVYVCMYVHTYVCMHVHSYVCLYIHTYIHMYVHTYVCAYIVKINVFHRYIGYQFVPHKLPMLLQYVCTYIQLHSISNCTHVRMYVCSSIGE